MLALRSRVHWRLACSFTDCKTLLGDTLKVGVLDALSFPPVVVSKASDQTLLSNVEYVNISGCTLENRNLTIVGFTQLGGCPVEAVAFATSDTTAEVHFLALDASNEGPLTVTVRLAGFDFPIFLGTVVPSAIIVDAVSPSLLSITTSTQALFEISGHGFNGVDVASNKVSFSTELGVTISAVAVNSTRTTLFANFSDLPPSASASNLNGTDLFVAVDSTCAADIMATPVVVANLIRGCPKLALSASAMLRSDTQ